MVMHATELKYVEYSYESYFEILLLMLQSLCKKSFTPLLGKNKTLANK